MAQSHKAGNKKPNFSNGKKWAKMSQNNLNVLKQLK
jgi:hypothetical protein